MFIDRLLYIHSLVQTGKCSNRQKQIQLKRVGKQ